MGARMPRKHCFRNLMAKSVGNCVDISGRKDIMALEAVHIFFLILAQLHSSKLNEKERTK